MYILKFLFLLLISYFIAYGQLIFDPNKFQRIKWSVSFDSLEFIVAYAMFYYVVDLCKYFICAGERSVPLLVMIDTW